MVADSDTAGTVGAAPHAAAPASGAERMAAIEALIAGPESAHYWDDPALQHEYRTLLAARDDDPRRDAARDSPAMAGAGLSAPLPAAAVRRALGANTDGARLLHAWERRGGAATHIARLQDAAGAVLRLAGDAPAFAAGFDTLPGVARLAVYAELANGPPGYAPRATDAAVARFATTREGAELVQAWGRDAAQRIGVFDARAAQVLARLPDAEAGALLDWFDALDGVAARAVILALTQ